MEPIETRRLSLVPATATTTRLELADPRGLLRLLGADEASEWPSASLREVLPAFLQQLEEDPTCVGWLAWYWILRSGRELVGGGGFKGRPSADGTVEIGYETCGRHRRRGYAKEAVDALVQWAFAQGCVRRVVAETAATNHGSRQVLSALGFEPRGADSVRGLLRFERRCPDATAEPFRMS